MSVHVGWDENLARALIDERSELEGAMLPILHALQEKFGYVDSRAVAIVASALNVSRSEVFGTISFYHDFKRQPPLGRTIKLCRAEACQARGAEDLAAHLEKSCGAQNRRRLSKRRERRDRLLPRQLRARPERAV